MSPITYVLFRIAAATEIGLKCAEATGFGHGVLPLGQSDLGQLAVLLGGGFVMGELTELVFVPLCSALKRSAVRLVRLAKKFFNDKANNSRQKATGWPER
jgi:hypothetical protein